MTEGIVEVGRYWFIWKCVELGTMLVVVGTLIGLVWHKIIKEPDHD